MSGGGTSCLGCITGNNRGSECSSGFCALFARSIAAGSCRRGERLARRSITRGVARNRRRGSDAVVATVVPYDRLQDRVERIGRRPVVVSVRLRRSYEYSRRSTIVVSAPTCVGRRNRHSSRGPIAPRPGVEVSGRAAASIREKRTRRTDIRTPTSGVGCTRRPGYESVMNDSDSNVGPEPIRSSARNGSVRTDPRSGRSEVRTLRKGSV